APPPRRRAQDKRDKDQRREPPKDPFKNDAGRPALRELRGRGVLVRRMARGFMVALDRDFKAAGTRWWRTTFGFAAPFDRIVVQNGSSKHVGSWFSWDGAAEETKEAVTPASDAGSET